MRSYYLLLFAVMLGISVLAQPTKVTLKISGGISNQSIKSKIEANTAQLLTSINTAYLNQQSEIIVDDKIITQEALKTLRELWSEVSYYCAVPTINENLLGSSQSYQIRNIPFVLGKDTQSAVINYNKDDGKITDFYFGLEIHHYKSVMQPEMVVDQTRREIILNFIESFRTAYIRKDIEFIEKVFSEHALIIIGRVIQQHDLQTDHMRSQLSKEQIEYQVLKKPEYIQRLKTLFSRNSHLILQFNEIEVNNHRKHPDFYGVLLEQYWQWTSATGDKEYGDRGYLFLVIQFRENDHPLIWVRTWQDTKAVEQDDVFGLHNFRITQGTIQQ